MTQGLDTQGPMGLSHALVVAQGLQGSLEKENQWNNLEQGALNTQKDTEKRIVSRHAFECLQADV